MPSHDSGRYFLTALIPIRADAVEDPLTAESVTSHQHALREVLASIPTAMQSPATEAIGLNSPFARDGRTHFARFAILDDVAFNGRIRQDAILTALRGPDPVIPQPVDRLGSAYLIYVTDFDCAEGGAAAVEAYLAGLFAVMEEEWRAILRHCHGYERVDGPAGFAKLIRACEVDTTMPFNDYWEGAPQLSAVPLKPFLQGALAGAGVLALGLVLGLFVTGLGWWLALAGLLGVVAAAFLAYRRVMGEGAKPFPPAPRSTLPDVLKALYVQQQFTRFAIAEQGADPARLHAAFGEFLATHKPDDVAAPTQPRGVVRS